MTFELYGCTIKYQAYQLILLVTFVISLYRWKRTSEKILLSSFFGLCVVFEMIVNKYFNCVYHNNAIPNNMYTIAVIWFYFILFKDGFVELGKVSMKHFPTVFSLGSLAYVSLNNLNVLHTGPYLIGLILTTGLIGFYLFNLINKTESIYQVMKAPRFWLGIGIVLFASANFPILFHLEEIRYNQNIAKPLFNIVQLSNIFLSLSYLICVLCHQQTKLYSTK